MEGRLPKYFFQEICFSGGKRTIHKVSAAFIVKNCHPRTSLIEAYYFVYNYDIIALSETYLDSSITNESISLTGFSKEIYRSDHPNDVKQGGVCLYFKDSLAIKQRRTYKY